MFVEDHLFIIGNIINLIAFIIGIIFAIIFVAIFAHILQTKKGKNPYIDGEEPYISKVTKLKRFAIWRILSIFYFFVCVLLAVYAYLHIKWIIQIFNFAFNASIPSDLSESVYYFAGSAASVFTYFIFRAIFATAGWINTGEFEIHWLPWSTRIPEDNND